LYIKWEQQPQTEIGIPLTGGQCVAPAIDMVRELAAAAAHTSAMLKYDREKRLFRQEDAGASAPY